MRKSLLKFSNLLEVSLTVRDAITKGLAICANIGRWPKNQVKSSQTVKEKPP